ncbi:Gfo/Idh/MocA family oxidoreductase [soil metagenome]
MRSLSEIGAAVIGSGFIGTVHIEALRRIGVPVRGLLGSSQERAQERAAKLGVPRGYGSLDELLDDRSVELVHVTSPNHLHYEHVRQILDAGRHVICEKPLAMDSQQTGELVRLADASGKLCAVNFNIRFYPLNQHLRQAIAEGAVGDVRLVSGHYFQDWLLLETDWNWRLEPQFGGMLRAVGDIGSHWLDLTNFVTGLRVDEVMADLATFVNVRRQPTGPVETFSLERSVDTIERRIATEDVATIMLRYANGARGTVAISQVSAGRKNSLQYEIDGSTAAAAWNSEQPDQLWLGHRDRPNELLIRNPALMNEAGVRAATLPGGHVEGFADTFAALFRAVYADVAADQRTSRPAYATFADGHEEALIGDAVAASAREGNWIKVDRAAADTPAGRTATPDAARPAQAGVEEARA